jgi:hypothetical protein
VQAPTVRSELVKKSFYFDPKSAGRAVLPNRATLICGLAVLFFAGVGVGQPSSKAKHRGSAHKHAQKNVHKKMTPISAAPSPPPVDAAPPATPPLKPEEMKPGVPQVSWDGQQLTILTYNSTLADILVAVRNKTGATIELPAGARERVAASLGPGPAREVLSSLLRGTDFDYVIQASDLDPQGIQNVYLTPRAKTPSVAGESKTGILAAQSRRDGYRTPGESKPAPVESPEVAAAAAEGTAAEGTAPAAPAETTNPQVATSGSQPPDPKPASADAPSASASPVSIQADLTPLSATPESDAGQPKTAEQRMQDMQSMFQQRRQMLEQARKSQGSN